MNQAMAFTGLRPFKLPQGWDNENTQGLTLRNEIMRHVKDLITKKRITDFYVGMANGSDLLCASVIIELKNGISNLALEAAVPFPNQEKLWPERDQRLYRRYSINATLNWCFSMNTRKNFIFKGINIWLTWPMFFSRFGTGKREERQTP